MHLLQPSVFSVIQSQNSKMWPVGSIYLSVNATNPETLFGGTWQQITGRFLLAAGGGYSAGTTGGEASHTLTVSEIPSRSHTYSDTQSRLAQGSYGYNDNDTMYDQFFSQSKSTGSSGGGGAHNNMPPYLVVYVWKRTA